MTKNLYTALNYDEDGSRPKFTMLDTNLYLDIHTMRAALRVSPSVVSLLSYSGCLRFPYQSI